MGGVFRPFFDCIFSRQSKVIYSSVVDVIFKVLIDIHRFMLSSACLLLPLLRPPKIYFYKVKNFGIISKIIFCSQRARIEVCPWWISPIRTTNEVLQSLFEWSFIDKYMIWQSHIQQPCLLYWPIPESKTRTPASVTIVGTVPVVE